MMRKLLNTMSNSRLHSKLMITFIVLSVIPMVAIGYSDYQLSRKTILEMTQNDVYTIVKKNNQIIDAKLSRVREMIYGFVGDKDVYHILSHINSEDKVAILQADLQLKAILAKYFAQSIDIYSVQLVSPYFTFGTASSANSEHAKNFVPYERFPSTELYRKAWEGEGKIQWYPTYNFAEMFDIEYLRDIEYDFQYLFSTVTLLNGSYSQNTEFKHLIEKPVLVVNFKESLFKDVFSGSMPTSDAIYFIVDPEGRVVFHPDDTVISRQMKFPMLERLLEQESGVEVLTLDQDNYIVASYRSDITGWLSVAMIPPKALLNPILKRFLRNAIITAMTIAVLFIGLSFALSRLITEPFRMMIRAIIHTGEGRFQTKFEEKGSYEFKVVMRKFTEMNEKIHKLIQENYESEIREKEAQIKALNLQLDPHFMYNTLNMVSLMALEREEYEVSDIVVSLSNMMKYLVRNDTTLVSFETDLTYLKSYIFIMTKRFEGSFEVSYDIDKDLYAIMVPKFFLQPLVENAFIHGFAQLQTIGRLHISCKRVGVNEAVFTIEDNGCGISEERQKIILSGHSHIGLMNVNDRIKAYFGDAYGLNIVSKVGVGTRINIKLPCSNEGGALRHAT